MFCFFFFFFFFFGGGRGHIKYLRMLREPGKNSGEEKDSCILHARCIKSQQRPYLIKLTLISRLNRVHLYFCVNVKTFW